MALFSKVADEDSARTLIQSKVSYNQISSYYQLLHPYATGMSSKSVRRFEKRYDNFLFTIIVVR